MKDMKKILASAVLAAFSIWASAAVVTRPQAETYARGIFSASRSMEAVPSDNVLSTPSPDGSPSFYVFNNPAGGWVILSGEDCTYPVLAYSDSGGFSCDGIPDNTRLWLSLIDRNVRLIRKSGLKQGQLARELWAGTGLRTKSGSGGKVLETAKWDQRGPYNNLCPTTKEDKKTVTGCIATAMAIVLRYHKWPEHGKGTLESYTTTTEKIPIDGYSLDSKNYDWDNMPLTYSSSASTAQKKAVAELMKDCGVMVQMDYTTEGSSALSSDIIPALARHMYYSSSARELYHSNYSDTEWLGMIKAEIDAGRPLLYGGLDEEEGSGHEFVCDGYDDSGFIHVNWGWGGSCNGYFAVSYIGDRDKGKVNNVYSYYDSAIFGLMPDPDAPSGFATELYLWSDSNNHCGLNLTSGEIAKGKDFYISVGDICNDSFETGYDGAVRAALIDRNGSRKEFIGEELALKVDKATSESSGYYTPGYQYIQKYKCRISGDIALGDAIVIYYRLPDGIWTRMGGDRTDYPTLSALGAFDACFLNVSDSYRNGQAYYPDIIPGRKAIRETILYYDNTLCGKGYATLATGTHEIKVVVTFTDGSSETLVQKIKVN